MMVMMFMMMWFKGPVQSAIDKVKSSGSLLLVFIQGDDDLSKSYEKFLSGDVKFKREDFVPIKILHDSVAHQQFKKIYVTVPVPSVFIIGTNGMPLAVVCSQDPSNLNNVISEAIAKHKKQNGTHIASDDTCNKEIPLSKDEIGTVEKMNSSDKENNIEIRSCQIFAEDKRMECEAMRICPTFFLYDTHSSCGRIRISQKVQSARIQFRLPSDEIRSWEFPSLCTLRDVKLYLMETVKLGAEFKLLRTFPRTAFTPQDENRTLTELSLTPNATLIVVPVQDEAIQSKIRKIITKKNFIFTFFSVVFQPVFTFFNYIGKFIHRAPEQRKVNQFRKHHLASRQTRISKKTSESNIHGFAFDESDTDSDMNTDNGNSTQQK